MRIVLAFCLCFVALQFAVALGQDPLGSSQNLLEAEPRSNVVMQSVVLGRRRPEFCDDFGDNNCGPGGGGLNLRRLLRRILGLLGPSYAWRYKKFPGEEPDAEILGRGVLERLLSKPRHALDKDEDNVDLEIDRLLTLANERPRKFARSRDGRRKREGPWRSPRHEDEDDAYFHRRRRGSDDEEDDSDRQRRKWRRRNHHKRTEWDEEERYKKPLEEEKRKNGSEDEWSHLQQKEWPATRNSEGLMYLHPQYSRHYIRPRPSEEYIKRK